MLLLMLFHSSHAWKAFPSRHANVAAIHWRADPDNNALLLTQN